ncbi:MAG: hypothetical protein K5930_03730 [Treponemataceae bacterium]|nr:hypothetical protein [Treponemataceae bacterium]
MRTDEIDDVIGQISSKILSFSGISVAKSQIPSLVSFLKKKAASRGISPAQYCEDLSPGSEELDEVINLVTVNETYFFREEKQFDFLKNQLFPKFVGKNLSIWTCCCSTGEEPVSILALALSMGVNLTLYASDIDDNALETLREGRWSLFSLRKDGQKYHELLEPYSKRTETQIIFDRDFLSHINIFKFNLIQDTNFPFFDNMDVIFMRNVFIYFDKKTRILVTEKIEDRLKNGGYLFFSMNEIGSIDSTIIPQNLHKRNWEQVYFFIKGWTGGEKVSEGERRTQKRIEEDKQKQEKIKKENLRREVEKARNLKQDDKERYERPAESEYLRDSWKKTDSAEASEKDTESDIKKTFEDICEEINRGNFTKARTIARAVSGANYKKYSFFLQGYIEYHADNRAAAETFFSSAETLSPDFWPAFFYHGMILRDLAKEEQALVCFSKCKKLLEEPEKKNLYDFTLDSFSPSYIHSLCETFSNNTRRQ